METGETRKFRLSPSSAWATIIAAVITGVLSFWSATRIEHSKNRQTILCERIKEDAEKYAFSINSAIEGAGDDKEKLITYSMWRDKFKEISNYDCEQINTQIDKIITFYKESGKVIKL